MSQILFENKAEIKKALGIYFGAFASLLPGFFFGPYILITWYIVIVAALVYRKIDYLIIMFIVWNFVGRGAFHYHLLGVDESHFLIRYINIAMLSASFVLLIASEKKNLKSLKFFFLFCFGWSSIAFISAMANNVAAMDFLQYFLIYFRWFLFALLIFSLKANKVLFRLLITLLFVIIGSNGIIAFFQQFVLPVQVTPTGYIPDYFDLASGLLGVTFSQHLTALSLTCSIYFLIQYFLGQGGFGKFLLFLIQPFSSSSKAFVIITGMLLVIIFFIALVKGRTDAKLRANKWKFITVALALAVGIQVYDVINENQFGGILAPLENYAQGILDPESVMKLAGYITSYELVAANGRYGVWFGVGPTMFLNVVSSDQKTEFSSLILRGNENEDLSTVDKQDTETVANIGELGIMGLLAQLLTSGYFVVRYLKKAMMDLEVSHRAFCSVILLLATTTFIFTLYTQAWSVAFYYIPLFVFISAEQTIFETHTEAT